MYTATHYKCIIPTCLTLVPVLKLYVRTERLWSYFWMCSSAHYPTWFTPRSISKVLHDFKKKWNKCVIVEDILKSGGDLFNGAQYACLSTRSQLIFSSSWLWGSGGLDLNAQLITAMHCTAHICNRTEWLQDFIALTSFYREKKNWSWIQKFLHTLCYCYCPNDWKWHALKLL